MGGPSASAEMISRAAAAVSAAARAGVEVRTLHASSELAYAARILTDVWQSPFSDHILRAFELSGNYVAGAFEAGRLVGVSVAFAVLGGEPELHSHITGVAESHRRLGVGFVLKLHQRCWALERDITLVNWTFDPLIRRNANFNLARLAAVADEYRENLYGDMDDALNGHDESDRLLVRWHLDDPEVELAAAGTARRVAVPPGTPVLLEPGEDLRPLARGEGPAEGVFTCRVPADVEALRHSDPDLASRWRYSLRAVLGGSLAAGARLLGMSEEGDYVVSAPGKP